MKMNILHFAIPTSLLRKEPIQVDIMPSIQKVNGAGSGKILTLFYLNGYFILGLIFHNSSWTNVYLI